MGEPGPSFGLVVMGRIWLMVVTSGKQYDEEEADRVCLDHNPGGMGGGYSAPLALSTASGCRRHQAQHVAAFIPELFATTLGFVIYYGVTGFDVGFYRFGVSASSSSSIVGACSVFGSVRAPSHTLISKLVSAAALINPTSLVLAAVRSWRLIAFIFL
jgi:hypothetical protein